MIHLQWQMQTPVYTERSKTFTMLEMLAWFHNNSTLILQVDFVVLFVVVYIIRV